MGFSINTLDEQFRSDMDRAVSIERRLDAMKTLHDSGIRTTCFISPTFSEITDVKAIIERVKNQCNLIWLENLNLRGDYRTVILSYIREKYPNLVPLYHEIYSNFFINRKGVTGRTVFEKPTVTVTLPDILP